eukprot:TRINITY_DN3253_c0_g3_i1.p1 TRINITY_DN3253_c0_g3~~TRINITY_DN3253_c0_g3_i1.p1  ORF type:complete len:122 (+),score=6.06 TRINITY_DN3253_c0_g3_i1:1311-1676(+)
MVGIQHLPFQAYPFRSHLVTILSEDSSRFFLLPRKIHIWYSKENHRGILDSSVLIFCLTLQIYVTPKMRSYSSPGGSVWGTSFFPFFYFLFLWVPHNEDLNRSSRKGPKRLRSQTSSFDST